MLARQNDLDHHWEDHVNFPYQPLPVPYASRLFKYIPPPNTPSWPSSNSDKTMDDKATPPPTRAPRAVRMRYGHGGRLLLDCQDAVTRPPATNLPRSLLFALGESDHEDEDRMDIDEDPEEEERLKRLEERWRFDQDDVPPAGPEGPDEQDRTLVDDYNPIYLQHTMTLFKKPNHIALINDPSVIANALGALMSLNL